MDEIKANEIKEEMEEIEKDIPEYITITAKEYTFLNAIFLEYTKIQTNSSDTYSLFSSHNSNDNLVLKNGST